MTALETQILRSLDDLDAAVKSMAGTVPKPDLLPLFTLLDELARKLPPGTDPDLAHYLSRKSYEKARQLLQSRAARPC